MPHARETIYIGGGNDWMPVDLIDRDHKPDPSTQVGMTPTCTTCTKGLIRLSVTEVRHVIATT